MDEKLWNELKEKLTKLPETMATKEEIKGLVSKVEDLERQFIDALASKTDGPPIIKGIAWASEKQAERFVDFTRDVFFKNILNLKAQSEGVQSEGGYLVPDEYQPTLIRLIETYGMVRQRATVLPMKAKTLTAPKLVSGVQVYWIAEKNLITETEAVFGLMTLNAKKMAALIPMTGELIEDSSIAIANLLITLIAEAVAHEEDRIGFVGDTGVGDPFMGILNHPDVPLVALDAGKTGFADATADDYLDLTEGVAASVLSRSQYYFDRTVLNLVRKLKDDVGNYIYTGPTVGEPATLHGYPVNINDVLPGKSASAADTPFAIFGELKHLYLGDRKKTTFATSSAAGFKNDITYLRVIQREGFEVGIGTAFSVLKTAAV